MKNRIATCGLFASRSEIQKAVDTLKDVGFRLDDISVLIHRKDKEKRFSQKNILKKINPINGSVTGVVLFGSLASFISIKAGSSHQIGSLAFSSGLLIDSLLGVSFGALIGAAVGALAKTAISTDNSGKEDQLSIVQNGFLLAVYVNNPEQHKKANSVLKQTGSREITELYEAETWEVATL